MEILDSILQTKWLQQECKFLHCTDFILIPGSRISHLFHFDVLSIGTLLCFEKKPKQSGLKNLSPCVDIWSVGTDSFHRNKIYIANYFKYLYKPLHANSPRAVNDTLI